MKLLLFAVLLATATCLLHRCPPKEVVNPCKCHQDVGNIVKVICVDADTNFLKAVIKGFQPYVIDFLHIKRAKIEKISKGIFSKLSIHRLKIEDSEIGHFDFLRGLDGLQETIEDVSIQNCTVREWWWSEGRHFVHLERIAMSNTRMTNVMRENMMQHMDTRNMKELEFVNCGIEEIEDKALRSFGRLKKLNLAGNRLTFVKRSLLPQPARHLMDYSLSNNPIKELADDMFLGMPRLEKLSLSNTRLTKLPLSALNPVWDQLEEVDLDGIPLICDCEAAWFLSEEVPKIFQEPTCDSPPKLKGRKVTSVKRYEMCSFKISNVKSN